MKHRIIICAAAALLLAPAVSHARWGLEAGANIGEIDDANFSKNLNYYRSYASANGYSVSGKVLNNNSEGSGALFVEGNAPLRLGASIGYGRLPELQMWGEISGGASYFQELKNKTQVFPITVYMKYAGKRVGVFAGGGVAHIEMSTRMEANYSGTGVGGTFKQTKLVPQAQAGLEVFLTRWLSVHAGVKMLLSAVFDDLKGDVMAGGTNYPDQRLLMVDGAYGQYVDYGSGSLAPNEHPFRYDLGGVRGNVGLRIYFK